MAGVHLLGHELFGELADASPLTAFAEDAGRTALLGRSENIIAQQETAVQVHTTRLTSTWLEATEP